MKYTVEQVLEEIERQAPGFGISPKVAKAFFVTENTSDGVLKPGKVVSGATTSPAGARGVMQTMPKTEQSLVKQGFLPPNWKFDPANLPAQVQAGLAALKEMRSRQKNPADVLELATMYNGGTGPWQAYRSGDMSKIPAETKQYWEKIQVALGFPAKQKGTNVATSTPPAVDSSGGGTVRSGSSSSTSTRTNVFDPAAFSTAMQAGMNMIKEGGNIDVAIQQIGTLAANRTAAEMQAAQAITQLGIAAGDTIAAQTVIDAGEARRKQNILRTANLDPSQMNNAFQQAVSTVNEGTLQLEQMGAEIDKRQAVGFFDNPLEYLVNQVRLPGMVGAYNASVKKQNRAVQQAQELQALTSNQLSISNGLDADAITAAGKAKAVQAAKQAQEALARVQLETSGAATRDAMNMLHLENEKFKISYDLANLTKQVMSEKTGMSEREAAAEAEQMQLDGANKYLKMIGSQLVLTPAAWKAMPAQSKQDLLSRIGSGVIASSFSDAASVINGTDNRALRGNLARIAEEGDASMVAWFQGTVAEAQKLAAVDVAAAENAAKMGGRQLSAKDRQAVLDANLDKLQQAYQGQTIDMRTASDNNPLKLQYVAISKLPELQDSPVAKFINKYGPASSAPQFAKIDEQMLIERFIMAAEKGIEGTTPASAAAALADFYKRATELQAQKTKYALFGLEKPSNGYTVKLPGTGFFASSGREMDAATVDLTNVGALQQYITKSMAVRFRNSQSYFSPQGPGPAGWFNGASE